MAALLRAGSTGLKTAESPIQPCKTTARLSPVPCVQWPIRLVSEYISAAFLIDLIDTMYSSAPRRLTDGFGSLPIRPIFKLAHFGRELPKMRMSHCDIDSDWTLQANGASFGLCATPRR